MQRALRSLVPAGLFWLALASAASAGYKEAAPVQIASFTATSGFAWGSLGTTRNDGTTNTYIGCWMECDSLGSANGGCQASNGTLPAVVCAFDPQNFEYYLNAMRNMTPSSFVVFAYDNGICTYVVAEEGSQYEPLKP